MNILIEALGIQNVGGGRSSIITLLESLTKIDKENQYCLLLCNYEPSLGSHLKNVTQKIAPIRNRFVLRIWAQLVIPLLAKNSDLVHFTKNLGVFGLCIPTIVTVHDLTTLIHPELFPRFDVWYWKNIQKKTLQGAEKIITVSHTTANDVSRLYNIPMERIRVIYNAIAPCFNPASNGEMARVTRLYRLPQRYFIHIGRIDKKKNLSFLIRAFARYRELVESDFKLVLVGEVYKKSMDPTLFSTINHYKLEKEVVFTGWVPYHDLPPLYSGAVAAVYPSFHEGFGLAHVEAMACGTPLIAHSAGAVTEVVGDSGILLDKLDENQFAEALTRIASDQTLINTLRQRGLERANIFKGDQIAHNTLSLYREIMKDSPKNTANN